MRRTLWICSLLVAAFHLQAAPERPAPASGDDLMTGKLPNGVRYALLPRVAAGGGLSARLVLHVGSAHELPSERGFAHFLEHMAFSGSRKDAAKSLIPFLQGLGLTIGADVNGHTGVTATIYKIDLPEAHTDRVKDVLALFRDFADGIEFEPDEVERERAVIRSELKARESTTLDAVFRMQAVLLAGTAGAGGPPGGTPADLERVTADALRAFYRRSYVAPAVTIVLVGDFDPTRMKQEIEVRFGSMAAGRQTVRDRLLAHGGRPRSPGQREPHLIVDPASPGAAVTVAMTAPRGTPDRVGVQHDVDRILATTLVNRRLAERREAVGGATLGKAWAAVRLELEGRMHTYYMSATASATAWPEALALLGSELTRIRKHGFTQAEINEAVTMVRNSLKHQLGALASTPNADVAQYIEGEIASGREWVPPPIQLKWADEALDGADSIRVLAAASQLFGAKEAQLFVILPQAVAGVATLARSAWAKARNEQLASTPPATPDLAAPALPEEPLQFAYRPSERAGAIADRRKVADLQLDLVRFANGVQLNVRRSEVDPTHFMLLARIGQGLRDVPKDRPGLTTIAAAMIANNDLRRHSNTELHRLLSLNGVQLRFLPEEGCGVLTVRGPATSLPFGFQLLTALLTDLHLNSDRDALTIEQITGATQSAATQPLQVAYENAVRLASGDDARFSRFPDRAMLQPGRLAETKQWLVKHWLQGPLEIGVIGALDADQVLQAAANTVGTLPSRGSPARSATGQPYTSRPLAGQRVVSALTSTGAALAALVWPVAGTDQLRRMHAAELAADVMADRLRTEFRDEKGATYTPNAVIWRSRDHPSFSYCTATMTFQPGQAERMTKKVVGMADALAERGASAEEFTRLLQPRRAKAAENLRDNVWWLRNVVSVAQTRPEAIEEARGYEGTLRELSLEDLNSALRAFRQDAVTAVVARPVGDASDLLSGTPAADAAEKEIGAPTVP